MRRLFDLRIIACATSPPDQNEHHNHAGAQVTSKSIECHCDVPPIIGQRANVKGLVQYGAVSFAGIAQSVPGIYLRLIR